MAISVGGGSGAVLGASSGVSNLANSLAAALGGSAGTYFQQLKPASYRGVSFVSLGGRSAFGRRVELHEYPKRDQPWPEDLGRRARPFMVSGYLVGDDVIAQRNTMIAAAELNGTGTLVHATYGQLNVTLLVMNVIERWDKGRYFELEFEFVEAGKQSFPLSSSATGSSLLASVLGSNAAAALNFASQALKVVSLGAAVLNSAVSTALGWYTVAKNVVLDAKNLFSLLTNLPGDFGRFFGSSSIAPYSTTGTTGQPTATVASLTALSVSNRVAVDTASATLAAAAANLSSSTTDAFAAAAVGVANAVLAATPDPADGMRLLTELAAFMPTGVNTTSVIGTGMTTMQNACADLFRRTCIAAVAQASSTYQPTSSDDAAQVRDTVTGLIDAELTIAGDQGEDETYEAMRTLRTAVVADLNARGAGLAAIKSFAFSSSLPAPVLANRIYRDASRADDLVAQAQPIHPLFMPATFKALSS
jgi:prophage DNA circulation protein